MNPWGWESTSARATCAASRSRSRATATTWRRPWPGCADGGAATAAPAHSATRPAGPRPPPGGGSRSAAGFHAGAPVHGEELTGWIQVDRATSGVVRAVDDVPSAACAQVGFQAPSPLDTIGHDSGLISQGTSRLAALPLGSWPAPLPACEGSRAGGGTPLAMERRRVRCHSRQRHRIRIRCLPAPSARGDGTLRGRARQPRDSVRRDRRRAIAVRIPSTRARSWRPSSTAGCCAGALPG